MSDHEPRKSPQEEPPHSHLTTTTERLVKPTSELESFSTPQAQAVVAPSEGHPARLHYQQPATRPIVAEQGPIRNGDDRFRQLAEAVPDVIFTTNPDGSCDYVNGRLYEYTGLLQGTGLGDGWMEAVHPDERERVEREWGAAVAEKHRFECRYQLRTREGKYRWFIARAYPVCNEGGGVIRWVGTSTDIHDFVETEAALKEAHRHKDEFLAMLAHELRNPLGPVRNAVQILQLTGPQEPALIRAREMIDRQVTHMVRLVDDLLDVSRLARGKMSLRKQRVDFRLLVLQTVEDFRGILEGSGLTLTQDFPDAPIWVDGDATRLVQIVGNLIHNAHKFTDAGGHVHVVLTVDAENHVEMTIRDTGIGMTEEVAARAFDIFTQAEQSLDRTKGGLGLGLALVKGLTQLHGGTVRSHSPGAGMGSEFTVRFACCEAPDSEIAPARNRTGVDRKTLRILIIEDNRDAAESTRMLLTVAGHDAQTAYTATAGLEATRTFRPHVVFCDIGLPGGMNGYDVARTLRNDAELKKTYLIALTGYGRDEDQALAWEAGFDLHMTKPVDFSALRRALAGLPARGRLDG